MMIGRAAQTGRVREFVAFVYLGIRMKARVHDWLECCCYQAWDSVKFFRLPDRAVWKALKVTAVGAGSAPCLAEGWRWGHVEMGSPAVNCFAM